MRWYICRNTSARRWGKGKLPVRQRVYWLGPIFVLVQPKRKGTGRVEQKVCSGVVERGGTIGS
jgi:hypothetical protein